ncbi:MAG: D-2-hydroxyacid dehydrogenase [Thermomicrobiales bacterium]
MFSKNEPVVVAIASPLEAHFAERITAAYPERTRVLYRPELMPATRFVADHGDPAFRRTPEQSVEWRAMMSEAEVTFDFAKDGTLGPRDLCPRLRWIQTTSAGVGPYARAFGLGETDVIVTTASGIHSTPLSEFTFAALLYWVKEIPRLQQQMEDRSWKLFCAGELSGQTLAIVGPGRIGREVARLARAFGMNVWAMARTNDPARAEKLGVDLVWAREDLQAMLAGADAVVLAMPQTDETVGMIGAAEIAAMKRGVMLVNIARGSVIDEVAMIDALGSGQIGFAALDVFQTEPLPQDSPLWGMPNVLINPHSASTAWRENERLTDRFIANLGRYLDGDLDQMTPRLDIARGY